MALCIHTGAVLWLTEYHGSFRADLYVVGAALVAYYESGPSHGHPSTSHSRDFMEYELKIGAGLWSRSRGMIVAPLENLRVPADQRQRWEEAGWALSERGEPLLERGRPVLT